MIQLSFYFVDDLSSNGHFQASFDTLGLLYGDWNLAL